MNRRNFMAAILATASAPAIVRAGSIMRINPAIITAPSVVWVDAKMEAISNVALAVQGVPEAPGIEVVDCDAFAFGGVGFTIKRGPQAAAILSGATPTVRLDNSGVIWTKRAADYARGMK